MLEVTLPAAYRLTVKERLRAARKRIITAKYYRWPVSGSDGPTKATWDISLARKLYISDGALWWCHGRWFGFGGDLTFLGRFRESNYSPRS